MFPNFQSGYASRLPYLSSAISAGLFSFALLFAGCGGGRDESSSARHGSASTASSANTRATSPDTGGADAESSTSEDAGKALSDYLTPVIVDEYNPDVTDEIRGKEQPKRGGILRIRTPTDFQELNPFTSTGQPEKMVQNLMFDALAAQDTETLEYYPVLARTYARADQIQRKTDETPITGIITEFADEDTSGSVVRFIPGAVLRTFTKYDVAEANPKEQTLTLREPILGKTVWRGQITEHIHTYDVNEGYDPELAEAAIEVPIEDLAIWKDQIGAADVARPFQKRETIFEFTVRDGATWHDGVPVTAQDVIFSYNTLMTPGINAQHLRVYYQDVLSATLLEDGKTVRFHTRKPYFQQFSFLAGMTLIPKHVFRPEQYGGDAGAFADAFNKHSYREEPLGNGPYRFVSWRKGESVRLERYERYWASNGPEGIRPNWKPAQPYLDAIELIVIQEKLASLKELMNGNLHADVDIEPDTWYLPETQTAEFQSKLVRAKSLGFLYTFIGWNQKNPIFQDPAVRRALGMLIPRDAIATEIHKGLANPVTGPFYSQGPGYNPDVPQLEYNPQEAKRILRRAGWLDRDGNGILEKQINGRNVELSFEYSIHNARDYHQKIADIVKEALEQAGIRMTIRKLDWAIFGDMVREQNFDAVRFAWGTVLDPDPFQIWHSSQMENKGDNFVRYRNARVDELCERIRETFEPQERWEMAREVHRLIAEDQPYTFLFGFMQTYFYDRNLHGVKFYPSQYNYDLTEWWWAKPPAQ